MIGRGLAGGLVRIDDTSIMKGSDAMAEKQEGN